VVTVVMTVVVALVVTVVVVVGVGCGNLSRWAYTEMLHIEAPPSRVEAQPRVL
jgi:hypothetical protein